MIEQDEMYRYKYAWHKRANEAFSDIADAVATAALARDNGLSAEQMAAILVNRQISDTLALLDEAGVPPTTARAYLERMMVVLSERIAAISDAPYVEGEPDGSR